MERDSSTKTRLKTLSTQGSWNADDSNSPVSPAATPARVYMIAMPST